MKKKFFSIKIAKKTHYYLGITLLLTFVFIGIVCLTISFKKRAEAAGTAPNCMVYLDPATLTKSKNETFNLEAKINPGTNHVSAVELHITFDHSRVRLDSLTANTVSGAFPDILQAAQIDNNSGTASIILGSGISGYVSSVTTMATLAFTAIGEGATTITIPTSTLAAAQGEGSTNVINAWNPAQITINARVYTITDFQNIASHWLQNVSGENNGDYNSDGVVDTRDIGIVMHSWQPTE